MKKEIKNETVILAQKRHAEYKHEQELRNANANTYSKYCAIRETVTNGLKVLGWLSLIAFLAYVFLASSNNDFEALIAEGKVKAETTEATTETETISSYLVDLNEVSSYLETDNGIVLTFSDGTEYLLESATETNYTYIICDVQSWTYTEDVTEIYCIMQDGSTHTYTAFDTPDEMKVVCFRTDNIDDFDTYEIVGIR